MAESREAFDRLDAMAESIDELKRSVAAITRSKALRAEVLEDLLMGTASLARIFLVVNGPTSQAQIADAYTARWGSTISKGGLSQKLSELEAMDILRRTAKKVAGVYLYTRTAYSQQLNIVRSLETALRARDGRRG